MDRHDRRNADEKIADDELVAGAYEVTASAGWVRKQGTPANWIAIPLGDQVRWISPARAFDVGW